MHTIRRAVLATAIVGLAVTGLAACSSSNSSSDSSSTNAQVIGPITADLSNLDGSTINATVGRSIDLTGDDTTFNQWSATTDPTGIVSFSNGYTSGGATFNPGLVVEAAGTTKVTLSNASTGQTVSFTVVATK